MKISPFLTFKKVVAPLSSFQLCWEVEICYVDSERAIDVSFGGFDLSDPLRLLSAQKCAVLGELLYALSLFLA